MKSLILGIIWLVIAMATIFALGYPTLMMIQDQDFDLLVTYALNIFLGCVIIGIAIFVGVCYLKSFQKEKHERLMICYASWLPPRQAACRKD